MVDFDTIALAALQRLDPERAHSITIALLKRGWVKRRRMKDDPLLHVRTLGLTFSNPIGLAAGFDKDAEALDSLIRLGFGFVEAGSVTPRAQSGNPRPRLFRLVEDRAVINRLGFNSRGLDDVAVRLRASRADGIVGANLGANRDSADRVADYLRGLETLGPLVDYVTINISSPNTPGLRALQGAAELDRLLTRLTVARTTLPRPVPLLLKVAPDLGPPEVESIADAALRHSIDGLIVGNTTIGHRAGLKSPLRDTAGGLSGRPLFAPSTALLADFARATKGRLVLIGTGGVASGADAYAKIRAGASLVQLYTALIYEGPALIGRIRRELAARLRADGFRTMAEAIGSGIS